MGYIFVSYSHFDKEYVHKLQDALKSEGLDVWIDDRIDYGQQWPKVIQEQLDGCDSFIVVMSENSLVSEWVQNEVTRAKRIGKPFFPLLLSGKTWLSSESIQYVDVKDGELPPPKFYQGLKKVITPSEEIQNIKSKADKLYSEGIRLDIEGYAERALQLFRQVKELDPFYPNIDMQIRNLEEEIHRGYVDQNGRVNPERYKQRQRLSLATIATVIGLIILMTSLLSPLAVKYFSPIPTIAPTETIIPTATSTMMPTSTNAPTETTTPTSISTLSPIEQAE